MRLPFIGEVAFTKSPEDFVKVFKDEQTGVFTSRLSVWALQVFSTKHKAANALFDMNEGDFFCRK